MAGETSLSDDYRLAFDIHQSADTNFHSRLNAFFVAQSFLVLAFVSSIVARPTVPELAIGVGVLGLVLTVIFWGRFATSYKRIWMLKRNYLINNDIYWDFIDGRIVELHQRRSFFDKMRGPHPMADGIPTVFSVAWVAGLTWAGHFFLRVGS